MPTRGLLGWPSRAREPHDHRCLRRSAARAQDPRSHAAWAPAAPNARALPLHHTPTRTGPRYPRRSRALSRILASAAPVPELGRRWVTDLLRSGCDEIGSGVGRCRVAIEALTALDANEAPVDELLEEGRVPAQLGIARPGCPVVADVPHGVQPDTVEHPERPDRHLEDTHPGAVDVLDRRDPVGGERDRLAVDGVVHGVEDVAGALLADEDRDLPDLPGERPQEVGGLRRRAWQRHHVHHCLLYT